MSSKSSTMMLPWWWLVTWCVAVAGEPLLDGVNLEQSIAAVLQKVAYGSTTKRSIPDTAYPVTTLSTPLLTTYRYSDGVDEYLRVDVARPPPPPPPPDDDDDDDGYGAELEKDHALPTSAPAADVLRNHHNAHYDNPNRHRGEKPLDMAGAVPAARPPPRPTKSGFSGKDVPSYVPPSRAFFTPPLPPEYLNPFADKPTLRGTNSDGFVNRRPIPPPSLVPGKERIPFRPDLPSKAVNAERAPPAVETERKKSLNTPSQSGAGVLYALGGRQRTPLNESGFEYDKAYVPSITRILSGSNGRHDDIPDVLLRTVTAPPQVRTAESVKKQQQQSLPPPSPPPPPSPAAAAAAASEDDVQVPTTHSSELQRAVNVTEAPGAAAAAADHIWLVAWNVHVYLAVVCYVVLAVIAVVGVLRFERAAHMFARPYFLTIHLLLTLVCALRIFYLTYDAYNASHSYGTAAHDFLHNFPLSLLATTFAALILFLLKHTLTHLRVHARPVFLVLFGLLHVVLCATASALDALGIVDRASLVLCRTVFVLLAWALGVSYLYLYKLIANVLAKRKSASVSDATCAARTSYASHLTIAVALLFVLLGVVQLYALFFIRVDRFDGTLKHHWILWSFELSVRLIEVCIIALLVAVASLRLSTHEKQIDGTTTTAGPGGGLQLFPCAASETSSGDNAFPNNCSSNPNATTALDATLPNGGQHYDTDFERFERPQWGSMSSRSTGIENPYSEPVEQQQRRDFERADPDRRSCASSSTSGRRTARKGHARPHLGTQTLPQPQQQQLTETMIVDEQGFVRFRHLQDLDYAPRAAHHHHHHLHHHHHSHPRRAMMHDEQLSHYSDA